MLSSHLPARAAPAMRGCALRRSGAGAPRALLRSAARAELLPVRVNPLQQARGLEGVKAAAKNYTMIAPKQSDDALQQGGLLVVDAQGNVAYAWRDEGTGDHAPVAQVLAAVAAAAVV